MQQDRPGWNPPPAQDDLSLSTPETVSSSRGRRSRIGTGVAVAAIAIGAVGIAGTAYAASASNTPAPAPSASKGYGQPGDGQRAGGNGPGAMGDQDGRRGHGKDGRMGMGMGGAIHGSFTVEKQGGGYQTVDTQRGTVTAVSKDSITVKSVDGFTKTYVVTADTLVNAKRDGIASVVVGDEVGVIANASGGTSTATRIMDRTQIQENHKKNAPAAPPAQPGSSAEPSESSTA